MKKILAFTLVIAMLAIAIVGGTMAYFMDTDAATNVMTMGGVAIVQHEEERAADGSLQAFTQNKEVLPAVGNPAWEDEVIAVGGGKQKVFDVENVIDKFVYVENTGKSTAFARTIVVMEAPDYDAKNLIHVNVNDTHGTKQTTAWTPIDIDGVQYVYAVFTYTDALAAGAKSPLSLAQVYLDPVTTMADAAAYDETWDIICLSQAVQAGGFADAETALNTAFGEATVANVTTWLDEME